MVKINIRAIQFNASNFVFSKACMTASIVKSVTTKKCAAGGVCVEILIKCDQLSQLSPALPHTHTVTHV